MIVIYQIMHWLMVQYGVKLLKTEPFDSSNVVVFWEKNNLDIYARDQIIQHNYKHFINNWSFIYRFVYEKISSCITPETIW